MHRPLLTAVLAVIFASIGQGLIGIFVKWVAWPPLALVCGRCVVASLFMWSLWALRNGRSSASPARALPASAKGKRRLLVSGLYLAAHWAALFYGYHLANVGPVVVAVFTFPIMASLVEPFVFGARPTVKEVSWAVVSAVGVGAIVLEGDAAEPSANVVLGVVFGLISAVFFAARNISSRVLLRETDAISIMAVQTSIVAVLYAPALLLVPDALWGGRELGLVLILGIGLTAIPHTVFIWAYRRLSVASSGVIGSLQVLSSIVFATVLLDERNPETVWFGAFLVIFAVVARSRASVGPRPKTAGD